MGSFLTTWQPPRTPYTAPQHYEIFWSFNVISQNTLAQFTYESEKRQHKIIWRAAATVSARIAAKLCNYNSFESHAITVMAPIKLQIVVIYRPPGQILAHFLEELDGLLSSFMEDGTPLLVFGRFQHSSRKALRYRLSFAPSFIWSQTPYHY